MFKMELCHNNSNERDSYSIPITNQRPRRATSVFYSGWNDEEILFELNAVLHAINVWKTTHENAGANCTKATPRKLSDIAPKLKLINHWTLKDTTPETY